MGGMEIGGGFGDYGDNNTVSAHNLPSSTRPFLRRQESHNRVPPTAASILAAMPPMAKRFLLPQEWSTCVRTIVGDFGDCAYTAL